MIFLASVPVETTTSSLYSFNDGSVFGFVLEMLLCMAGDFINLLRSFKFWEDVSYFDFFIALNVMSIVIVYLLNIARSPGVETTSGRFSKENRRREREELNSYKKQTYSNYLDNRNRAYKEYLNNRGKK